MRTPVSGEGVEDDVIHCLPALQRYIDGALSNNLPFSDSPTTITVSPFYGTVDICPQSRSGSLYELTAFNASFQISTINFFQGFISLFPPKPEVGHPAWSWPMTPSPQLQLWTGLISHNGFSHIAHRGRWVLPLLPLLGEG